MIVESHEVVIIKCNTKYPILFVHGANARDFSPINYWGRIPEILKKNGAAVYFGGQDAWGTIESNANIIKNTIDRILEQTSCGKINIIAHSKGGLDVRYLIGTYHYEDKIASLTTISTPHYGSKTMELIAKLKPLLYFASVFTNIYCKIIGDSHPDFYNASRQLSSANCLRFNKQFPFPRDIYFQSYAAAMKTSSSDMIMAFTHLIVYCVEGVNDGLVAVSSTKYNNFKGVLYSSTNRGVSHCDIVDYRRKNLEGFDIVSFYVKLVSEFKDKGF